MQFRNTFSGRIEISLWERSKNFNPIKFLKTEVYSVSFKDSVKFSIKLLEKLIPSSFSGSLVIFSKRNL